MCDEVTIALVRPPINVRRNSPFFLPLGLLCIAAPLREAGFHVEIIDYEYLYRAGLWDLRPERWLEDVCEPVLGSAPLIIGLTALADTLPTCILIGQYLKRRSPGVTVVVGGPGVFGTFPELLTRYPDAVDYVCAGEGELCFTELAHSLAAGEHRPEIAGLQYVREGQVVDPGRHRFANLDSLPMPAYDALPVTAYLELASPRIFDIYAGSGCTYLCRFCVTSLFWSREFRSKSPQVLMRELDYLYTHFGVRQFNFLHDNFANQPKYLDEFVDYFCAHNSRYEWGCAVRPDNVTLDQLKRMKRAGCFNVFCGTDSGSPRILQAMQKMPSARRSYDFFSNCSAAGLAFETNTIIGYPNESDDDLEDSLALIFSAAAHGSKNSDVSILQPLPGAPVTEDYASYLEYVEADSIGTFIPAAAEPLVKSAPRLFSGFYFIRNGNREFARYSRLVDRIRYFTRHWLRTIWYLKKACNIRIIDILDAVDGEARTAEFALEFERIVESLELAPEARAVAESIFRYDSAEEAVASVDVASEVENIYAAPRTLGGGATFRVIDLPVAVHRLFANSFEIATSGAVRIASTYLMHRSEDGGTRTLFLKPWQRDLWREVEAGNDTAVAAGRAQAVLAGLHPEIGCEQIETSVRSTVELFQGILAGRHVGAAVS